MIWSILAGFWLGLVAVAASGQPSPSCADKYAPCTDCCVPGFQCHTFTDGFSQCVPSVHLRSGAAAAPTCSANYAPCHGKGWTSPFVCCRDPTFECTRKNPFLSLCEPKKAPTRSADQDEPGLRDFEQCTADGAQACAKHLTCVKMTEWYSHCVRLRKDGGDLDDGEVYLPRWADCGEGVTMKCNPEDVCREYTQGSGQLQCTMGKNNVFREDGANLYNPVDRPYLGECGR